MKSKYHIDVDPEENLLFRDKPEELLRPARRFVDIFNRTFWFVFGIHALAASIFAISCSAREPKNNSALVDYSSPVQEIPEKHTCPPIEEPKQTIKQSTVKKAETKYAAGHTIQKGDTLYSIAKKYKVNVKRLAELNNIKDPNKIIVGQTLKFIN
jgi:nucleoid-associated protein YgaU